MCVEAYRQEAETHRRHINSAFMTFVVLDADDQPQILPWIRPQPGVSGSRVLPPPPSLSAPGMTGLRGSGPGSSEGPGVTPRDAKKALSFLIEFGAHARGAGSSLGVKLVMGLQNCKSTGFAVTGGSEPPTLAVF